MAAEEEAAGQWLPPVHRSILLDGPLQLPRGVLPSVRLRDCPHFPEHCLHYPSSAHHLPQEVYCLLYCHRMQQTTMKVTKAMMMMTRMMHAPVRDGSIHGDVCTGPATTMDGT